MKLSLLRHAIAVARGTAAYPGDDRPLAPKGSEKMRKASAGIVRILDRPDIMLTSPMIRAVETARIVQRAYAVSIPLESVDALRPGADAARLLDLVRRTAKDHVMLVGHEPDLSLIIEHLLGSTGGRVELKKGGLAHLALEDKGSSYEGRLLWLIKPRHLRMLGKEKHQ